MGISVFSFFIKWQSCEKPVRRRKMTPPAIRTRGTISLFHVVNSLASSIQPGKITRQEAPSSHLLQVSSVGALEECTLVNVQKQLAAAESVVSSLELNVCLSFFSPVFIKSKLDFHNADKFPDISSESTYNECNNKPCLKHCFFHLLAEVRGKGLWFSVCSFSRLFFHMKTNTLISGKTKCFI